VPVSVAIKIVAANSSEMWISIYLFLAYRVNVLVDVVNVVIVVGVVAVIIITDLRTILM
jgi:hypothetical protein